MLVSGNRRLLIPAAVVVGLLVPSAATSTATASSTPKPQHLTGIVQTIIREVSPSQRATARAATDDTTKVLRVGSAIVPLAEGSLPGTKDGSKVSVTVVAAADGTKQVLSASTIAAPVAAAESLSTQHLYVAIVLPKTVGLTAETSITVDSVNAMVATVSDFWSSQTGSQVTFIASDIQSYSSAYPCGDTLATNNTVNMWNEAQAKMLFVPGPGQHLVVIAPSLAYGRGCAFGLATIGSDYTTGGQVFVSGLEQSLLAHELGHNMGLNHSNSFRCTSAQDMPVINVSPVGCEAKFYDDLFDVMGFSGYNDGLGNLNAVHLDAMNLLPNAVRKIPADSGVTTATITPLSFPLSDTTTDRALKITDPSGAHYFVEYRINSGRDAEAGLTGWSPAWGVRVLRDDPADQGSAFSYELDATPTSIFTKDYNRSVPVGGTFTSASKKLTIRVAAQDADGATLTIANWAAAIVPATVTLSKIPTKALVGTVITAATRVTDGHARPVAGWIVTLQKRQRGTTTWKTVSSVRTSSTGAASYRFANGVSGSYRWVSAATGVASKISPSVAVISTARIVEARPATSMTHGAFLSVRGSVSSVPAPIVYIQYRYAGSVWHTGPRATVTGTTVSGRIALYVRATAYTRLYITSATPYTGAVSGSFATTVR